MSTALHSRVIAYQDRTVIISFVISPPPPKPDERWSHHGRGTIAERIWACCSRGCRLYTGNYGSRYTCRSTPLQSFTDVHRLLPSWPWLHID
ncbi:hypothetical protein IG631_05777 [Alternaria alternata]|nr:hypothetical protein IG631_05777 [Alternaria alternata]